MRRTLSMTFREAGNLYNILRFVIPQLSDGKPKRDAQKLFENIAIELNLVVKNKI